MLLAGGPASVNHPGAVKLTFHEFCQSPSPDSFQNVNCIFQINFFKKGAEMFSQSMDGFLSSVADMVQR